MGLVDIRDMAPFKDPFSFLLPGAQGVFVCSVIFCVWTMTRPVSFSPPPSPMLVEADSRDLPELAPWEEYAQLFKGRDIFMPVEEMPAPVTIEPSLFRVAGLLRGRRSSVVLEKTDGGALFLSEGERHGQVLVKKIHDASVELEVAGQPIILELGGRAL